MATKSHFCEAMLSMAARCLVALSSPSNQVTSTLKSLPQNSAACLPWAHQVACSPAFENAAFRGFSDRPISAAAALLIRESMPKPPSTAAAPAEVLTLRMKSRRVAGGRIESIVIASSLVVAVEKSASRCAWNAIWRDLNERVFQLRIICWPILRNVYQPVSNQTRRDDSPLPLGRSRRRNGRGQPNGLVRHGLSLCRHVALDDPAD